MATYKITYGSDPDEAVEADGFENNETWTDFYVLRFIALHGQEVLGKQSVLRVSQDTIRRIERLVAG